MKPEEIRIGTTYTGGKFGERRTVVGFGSSDDWICWALTKYRLPLGGFMQTRCTSRKSFAAWAASATGEHG